MKLGFAIPIVGPAASGAPGLSAFCRGLEDLGYDTLWVGDRPVTPVDVDSSYLAHGPQMTRSLVRCCCGPSPRRRPAGCA